MLKPLELSFRHIDPDDRIKTLINKKVEKLEHFCDHISGCRIAVERQHKENHASNPYRVRIDLTVPPGHELVVMKGDGSSGAPDSLEPLIHDAFDAMARKLKNLSDK